MYMTQAEQKEQEELTTRLLKTLESETEEQKEEHRKLLKVFLKENEANSSKGTSSSQNASSQSKVKKPRNLVEDTMQRYGFSREKALEELDRFDW